MIELEISDTFAPLLEDEHRYLLMYGGSGSGKSEFAARKLFYRARKKGGHRFLVVRKVRRVIMDSCVQVYKQFFSDVGMMYEFNKSALTMRFANRRGVPSELLFYGLDDQQKLKSIKGITSAWVEEATELTKEDFMQLDLRVREPTPHYHQLMLTFNPDEAKAAWIKDMFFDEAFGDDYSGAGKKPESYLHHSTLKDNPIPEARARYEGVLENLDDATFATIYRRGRWAAAKGRIFYWPVEPLPFEDESWYDDIWFGLDFGFTVNPSAVVKIYRKGLRFWLKVIIYDTGLTNLALGDALIAHPEYNGELVFCDAAEPKSITELRGKKVNAVAAIKGQDSVEYGLTLLQALDIRMVEGWCKPLVDEQKTYVFKMDSRGQPTGQPVKFNDHAHDGGRYGIVTYWIKYLMPGRKRGRVHHAGMRVASEIAELNQQGKTALQPPDSNATAGELGHGPVKRSNKAKPLPPTTEGEQNVRQRRRGRVYVP